MFTTFLWCQQIINSNSVKKVSNKTYTFLILHSYNLVYFKMIYCFTTIFASTVIWLKTHWINNFYLLLLLTFHLRTKLLKKKTLNECILYRLFFVQHSIVFVFLNWDSSKTVALFYRITWTEIPDKICSCFNNEYLVEI